ncbi:hypothetical protein [Brevibacterium oceani]|uniref:hypothetical protein n=1 Tax=Brevibacterium oceani TaxID=358099 RepID=UPI001B322FBC|nr:hypothetical protein [Brevibacterium oceani]
MIISADEALLRALERAPLRTLRLREIRRRKIVSNPSMNLAVLMRHGLVTRITRGTYTANPDGFDEGEWMPGPELRALAWAAATYGDSEKVALAGLSAAAHWVACPRPTAEAWIIVDDPYLAATTTRLDGAVDIHVRDVSFTDYELTVENTVLGQVHVLSPRQTLADLERVGAGDARVREAIDLLRAQDTLPQSPPEDSRSESRNQQQNPMEEVQ